MTITDVIVDREARFFSAQTAADTNALRALFAEDLRFVHTTGVVDGKDGYLAGVAEGRYSHGDIVVLHHRVIASDDGRGAVSVSVVDLQITPPDASWVTIRIHHLLAWRRDSDGEWRIVLRQATRQPL